MGALKTGDNMTITSSDKMKIRQEIHHNFKKVELRNFVILQLKIIEALDKEAYSQLQKKFLEITQSQNEIIENTNVNPIKSIAPTRLNMAGQLFKNDSFKRDVGIVFNDIVKKNPRQAKAIEVAERQSKLKWLAQTSIMQDGRTIHSPINFTQKILVKKSIEEVREDIKKLLTFLAPRACITRTIDEAVTETPLNCIEDLISMPIDAILILGNNDLKQVDRIADIYHYLKRHHQPPHKIYISGCGGHGTTLGYIFGSSEAEAMAKRLKDRGIPENILTIENDATDTIKNIELITPFMLTDALTFPINHLLISGTPIATFRQSRLFEKLSRYPWQKIATFPPTPSEIDQQYNIDEQNIIVNMVYSLREAATLLTYSSTSPFMSTRKILDEPGLTHAIQLVVAYYNIFTGNKINGNDVATMYIMLMRTLADASTDEERIKIQKNFFTNPNTNSFAVNLQEMNSYFRLCFEAIEREYMKNIRSDTVDKSHPNTPSETKNRMLSLNVQAAILNEQEKNAKEKSLSPHVNALIDSPFALKKAKNKFSIFHNAMTESIPEKNSHKRLCPF